MSTGFEIARSLIDMHRDLNSDDDGNFRRGRVPAQLGSLLPGAFIVAFANAERHTKDATQRLGLGRDSHLGSRTFVESFGRKGVHLAARMRHAPRGSTNIWRWGLLEGEELQVFLRDAYEIRSRLAHSGSGEKQDRDRDLISEVFKDRNGREKRLTLMCVEGILQATQDIAYLSRPPETDWEWQLPRRTSASNMPARLRKDERFPLPAA